MRILFTLLFFFVNTLYAGTYQVITDKDDALMQVDQVGKTIIKRGRLHVVKLYDGIKYETLPKIVTDAIRPIDLKDAHSYRYRLTKDASFDASIDEVVQKVSPLRMKKDLEHLVTFPHRRVMSKGNKMAQEWIAKRFGELGLEVDRQCFTAGSWRPYKGCNILGKREGLDAKAKPIVVVAHFDDVGKENAGADDNGSGIVAMFEMARVLRNVPLNMPVIFVAVDAEEVGILGSAHYVRELREKGELKNLDVALVMDVIGYNTNNLFIIETYRQFEHDAIQLAKLAASYSKLEVEISLNPWGSDHMPFLKAGAKALFTSQDWANHNPCYHKSCDTIEKVDFDYVSEITKVNVAQILSR